MDEHLKIDILKDTIENLTIELDTLKQYCAWLSEELERLSDENRGDA